MILQNVSVTVELVAGDEDGGGSADEFPPVRHSDADEIGAVRLAVAGHLVMKSSHFSVVFVVFAKRLRNICTAKILKK